jgi:arsenate reductase
MRARIVHMRARIDSSGRLRGPNEDWRATTGHNREVTLTATDSPVMLGQRGMVEYNPYPERVATPSKFSNCHRWTIDGFPAADQAGVIPAMKLFPWGAAIAVVMTATPVLANEARLVEPVRPFVQRVVASQNELPENRREMLAQVAASVAERIRSDEQAQLVFICTHNSRRSHLSQVWCQVAAEYHGVPGIHTFSGGIETTACNIRTVRSLRRAGLSVAASTGGDNPVYLIQYTDEKPPIRAFSKVYSEDGNPSKKFVAMMCCSDADEKCPLIVGADRRFPLHYDDPKSADGTPQEAARYDERSFQIACEMFFVMSQVADKLKAE